MPPSSAPTQSRASSSFRVSSWDPQLILGQIICLQSCYYTLLGFLCMLMDLLWAQPLSLDHLLSFRTLRTDIALGWFYILMFIMGAAVTALLLQRIVHRAKLCLDFTLTLYGWHLVFSWVYGGFPTAAGWWLQLMVCILTTSLLGEYVCMRKEMEPILLKNNNNNNTSRSTHTLGSHRSLASGGAQATSFRKERDVEAQKLFSPPPTNEQNPEMIPLATIRRNGASTSSSSGRW